MPLSQMQVFNEYIMPATIETLGQMVEKFNGASNGAIRLTTEGFTGDFLQESFFAAIHSAQRRVDRYAAQASAAATDLTQLKHSITSLRAKTVYPLLPGQVMTCPGRTSASHQHRSRQQHARA